MSLPSSPPDYSPQVSPSGKRLLTAWGGGGHGIIGIVRSDGGGGNADHSAGTARQAQLAAWRVEIGDDGRRIYLNEETGELTWTHPTAWSQ